MLKYFFGGGEFHIGHLVDLQLKLGNQEKFDRYCVLSKKHGKFGPKAGVTIANECCSVILICDMVCNVSWYSPTMVIVAQRIAKCMCKLSNNFSKDGRNKSKRNVIVGSEEAVLSPAEVQGYLIHEKVLNVWADMKATDYIQDLMSGKMEINQDEMYYYGKHLAMYLMVAYAKRPVVIRSMRLHTGHQKGARRRLQTAGQARESR